MCVCVLTLYHVWNLILYRMVLPKWRYVKNWYAEHEGKWGKIQYMKVPIFYPTCCIYTCQVCTTFWVGKLIETSKECIYGIIGIRVSVHMHVFRWSPNTYFGLQEGVNIYEKNSNLFFRYLEGGLDCVQKISVMYKGCKRGCKSLGCTKLGNCSLKLTFMCILLNNCMFY